MSNSSASIRVTPPEAPNSRMIASPMTNGGVMIGSIVSARSQRVARSWLRVTASAKASPSSVVPAPTRIARNSEFHAAPQLNWPPKQPSPQIFASVNFATKVGGDRAPESSARALSRMPATGKKIKTPTRPTTRPIAPVTKTSPPIAPRAAMPWVNMNRNAAQTTSAP